MFSVHSFVVGKALCLLEGLLEIVMADFLAELYNVSVCLLGLFSCTNHSFALYVRGRR